MGQHEVHVTREALQKAAARYHDVRQDHTDVYALTQRTSEIKSFAAQDDAVKQIMDRQSSYVEAMRSINYNANTTLQRLADALDEAYEKYRTSEDNNQELVKTLWGDLGKIPANVPLPDNAPPERKDWSDMSASRRAHLADPFRENWDDVEASLSAWNLDFTFWNKAGNWIGMLIEPILGWMHLIQATDQVKASWLPVDQMGDAVEREGICYRNIYEDLRHDRDVLHSNWEGIAGDAASGALSKIAAWFYAAMAEMIPLGHSLQEKAESYVAAQLQLVGLISSLVALIPYFPATISAALDGGTISEALRTHSWGVLLAAVWDLILQFLGIAFEALGVILFLWRVVIAAGIVVRQLIAMAEDDDLTALPPVWN